MIRVLLALFAGVVVGGGLVVWLVIFGPAMQIENRR